jgi:hypothetical protein
MVRWSPGQPRSVVVDARVYRVSLTLTCVAALGWPRKEDDDSLLLGESSNFPEWVFLLRGTHGFIEVAGIPEQGILVPLFKHSVHRFMRREAADRRASRATKPLEQLRGLIQQRALPEDQRQIYSTCIDELQKSFAQVYDETGGGPYEQIDAFIWIFMVAEQFLPLLQVPTQEAMVLFAYFSVLLDKLDHRWWFQGWGRHLMGRIHPLLDDETRLWISWPAEEMGWVPPCADLST